MRTYETPLGLIPARAGKTTWSEVPFIEAGAHPRAGGENVDGLWVKREDLGSSPRGRGKPGRPYGDPLGIGLIPARAGKTRT